MSDTKGHTKRTHLREETWSRRSSFAMLNGWWLNLAKKFTHRAERRESRRIERAARLSAGKGAAK